MKEHCEEIITEIKAGATWGQLSDKLEVPQSHLQLQLKKYLGNNQRKYWNIVQMAKTNFKKKYIEVAETGALLHSTTILENVRRVFVPSFCKDEIEKMAPESELLSDFRICWSSIHWDRVSNLPVKILRNRTIGMTAFCNAMAKRYPKNIIRVHTSSKELEELLADQELPNIQVKLY